MSFLDDPNLAPQLRAIKEQHRKDTVGTCILSAAISFALIGAFLLLVNFFQP